MKIHFLAVLTIVCATGLQGSSTEREKKEDVSNLQKFLASNYPLIHDYLSGEKKYSSHAISPKEKSNFNYISRADWPKYKSGVLDYLFDELAIEAREEDYAWNYAILKEFESLWNKFKDEPVEDKEEAEKIEDLKTEMVKKIAQQYEKNPIYSIRLVEYKNKPFLELWNGAETDDEKSKLVPYLMNNVATQLTNTQDLSRDSFLDEVKVFIDAHGKEMRKFERELAEDQLKKLAAKYRIRLF